MNLEFIYWTKEMRKVSQLKDAKAAAEPVGKICQYNEVLENGVCDNNTKKNIVKVRRFQNICMNPVFVKLSGCLDLCYPITFVS